MITISLCMIVKNEEKLLARCLDGLKDLVDEMIIVDTGSSDRTKEVASRYTDKIYDFKWIDDFAAARNFSFSKASMDYIYCADADEILDEQNQQRFQLLKEAMLPEIEIVQMKYCNQLEFGAVYNFDAEYRPKLFKRLREFVWMDEIHETVRLDPIVFDSDIEIIHKPESAHGGRDLQVFAKLCGSGKRLSKKLLHFCAQELMIVGAKEDFLSIEKYFQEMLSDETRSQDELLEILCVLTRAARYRNDIRAFYRNALKNIALAPCSEICYALGESEFEEGNFEEAATWYQNAAFETGSILDIRCSGVLPLLGLSKCCKALGDLEKEQEFLDLAENWRAEH